MVPFVLAPRPGRVEPHQRDGLRIEFHLPALIDGEAINLRGITSKWTARHKTLLDRASPAPARIVQRLPEWRWRAAFDTDDTGRVHLRPDQPAKQRIAGSVFVD